MRIYDHTGERHGTWTITGIEPGINPKTYRYKCDCGNEKLVPSRKVFRKAICLKCQSKIHYDKYKGERNGIISCLGHKYDGKRHGLAVRCDCGHEYWVGSYHQFIRTSSCKSCAHGFYPGKRVGCTTLIENMHNRLWKKKCDCGNIFISKASKPDCGCIAITKRIREAEKKIGKKYHYLTVKKIIGNKNGHILLLIRCKCGKEFTRHNGHEFKSRSCGCELVVAVGEKASKATLKNCEVISIRELHASGLYTVNQLATMFNKPTNYLRRIIGRFIWKHV